MNTVLVRLNMEARSMAGGGSFFCLDGSRGEWVVEEDVEEKREDR